jgi:Uma2 family endonuclease
VAVATPPEQLTLRSDGAGWNRERWERMGGDGNRYEVIFGVLHMTTSPSVFHQWIVKQLVRLLSPQVDDVGVGMVFWAPIGVFMPGCDPVQPDLLVVGAGQQNIITGRHIEGVPVLLVEVQSPGNAAYDATTKRHAYARAGVREYWIVRPASRDVLVLTEPDQALGDFASSRLVLADAELESPTLPVRFRVEQLFAGAPDTTL